MSSGTTAKSTRKSRRRSAHAQNDQLLTFAIALGFADVSTLGALGVDADTVAGFDIYGGVGG